MIKLTFLFAKHPPKDKEEKPTLDDLTVGYVNPENITVVMESEYGSVLLISGQRFFVKEKPETIKTQVQENNQRAMQELMIAKMDKYYQDGQPL